MIRQERMTINELTIQSKAGKTIKESQEEPKGTTGHKMRGQQIREKNWSRIFHTGNGSPGKIKRNHILAMLIKKQKEKTLVIGHQQGEERLEWNRRGQRLSPASGFKPLRLCSVCALPGNQEHGNLRAVDGHFP